MGGGYISCQAVDLSSEVTPSQAFVFSIKGVLPGHMVRDRNRQKGKDT